MCAKCFKNDTRAMNGMIFITVSLAYGAFAIIIKLVGTRFPTESKAELIHGHSVFFIAPETKKSPSISANFSF